MQFGRVPQVLGGAAAAIWPRACAACGCDAIGPVCDACGDDLSDASAERACPACGQPAGSEATTACPWCGGAGDGPIRRTVRLWPFAGAARTLIHAAKFGGRWELSRWLGERLADRVRAAGVSVGLDAIVVPVPLHPHRRALRGHDQAAGAAAGLAAGLKRPVVAALERCRATAAQTSLTSIAARRRNVRDCFTVVDPPRVAGHAVLLVDDVRTTGATLRSAARELLDSGAGEVVAAVLAVADPRRRGELDA